MNRNIDTSLIDKAIIYATKYHANTSRKGNKVPYIVHPLEAMSIVASITDDLELIAAAALHDLIEDTEVTYEDLLKEFGRRIADIVADESNNLLPNYSNLSWKEKKQLAFDKLKHSSVDCKIVALADKLSNMRSINNDFKLVGDSFWERFNEKNPALHKWRFFELLKCFEELEETRAFKEFRYLVFDTFSGVK